MMQDHQADNHPVIDLFTLADRAEAIGGKLYMMGAGWDRYFVQDDREAVLISFALVILMPWDALNRPCTLSITIENTETHRPIDFAVQLMFTLATGPETVEGETQRMSLAVPVVPVSFPTPGRYQAIARIDGVAERRYDFRIEASPASLGEQRAPGP